MLSPNDLLEQEMDLPTAHTFSTAAPSTTRRRGRLAPRCAHLRVADGGSSEYQHKFMCIDCGFGWSEFTPLTLQRAEAQLREGNVSV